MKDFSAFFAAYGRGAFPAGFGVYPQSVHAAEGGGLVCMADAGDFDMLVASGACKVAFHGMDYGTYTVAPLTHGTALVLRRLFPFTRPVPVLSRPQSCGVGDRLGIAGDGLLRAFAQCNVAPVLAQQSVRELTLTGRGFADVLDAASFAVFRNGYTGGFGADGDHLKTLADIRDALDLGYTMITLDCSEHIRADGETDAAIYDAAIAFAVRIWETFFKDGHYSAELEISIDETETPTTPAQHRYIAEKLQGAGVRFASLAPRFCGQFQKGVDYRGDLAQFERELIAHAAIAKEEGYKLSIHSGSDKFSVFPIIAKHCTCFHLKTAGTNWLEAMRVCAEKEPDLYRRAHAYALEIFAEARKYYHVSTDLTRIPPLPSLSDTELPALLDADDARQLIHITYGFILQNPALRAALFALWRRERETYACALHKHIGRHLSLITGKPLRG
ncbi:MAG: tagaturonate epimerase family protein [Clostridiales bacterium]|nr:tagaturonate epimerase family protein [Clostridiales bacterium]